MIFHRWGAGELDHCVLPKFALLPRQQGRHGETGKVLNLLPAAALLSVAAERRRGGGIREAGAPIPTCLLPWLPRDGTALQH